jgi:hypothetical protein
MIPMIAWLAAALVARPAHITPTVILVKRPEAVKTLLPGAGTFVAREVHLSERDAHRLHETVDWSPDDGVLTFYTGMDGNRPVGTMMFMRVDTPHGPVEVAVAFAPTGEVSGVLVTKATVETKPWVAEAVRAGLTAGYRGLRPGAPVAGAATLRDKVGSLAAYMAEQVDKGVARALAAYGAFYNPGEA